MRTRIATAAVVLFGLIIAPVHKATAVESGYGFYLLGSTTTSAGILPPPGTYVLDYNYFYSGSTDFTFETAGLILEGGVEGGVYGNVPAPLWVAPGKVLGERLHGDVGPVGFDDFPSPCPVFGRRILGGHFIGYCGKLNVVGIIEHHKIAQSEFSRDTSGTL